MRVRSPWGTDRVVTNIGSNPIASTNQVITNAVMQVTLSRNSRRERRPGLINGPLAQWRRHITVYDAYKQQGFESPMDRKTWPIVIMVSTEDC